MSSKEKNLEGLTISYWEDVETIMNYISNSVNLDGVRAEKIKKSLTAEVADELNNAQTIAKRIKELGASVPCSMHFKTE
jgi:bacterioferritin